MSDTVNNFTKPVKTTSIVGIPEFSTPNESGYGILSATDRRAKTTHQIGIQKFTAVTEEDADGDQYYYIYDEQGNQVYSATFDSITSTLDGAISSKVKKDHIRATRDWFDECY